MPDRSETEVKKKPAYNKVYTPEEKGKILAFAREFGVVDAARKFNVSTTSIRNWTKQAEQQPMIAPTEVEQPVQKSIQFPIQEPAQSSSVQEQLVQPSAHEEITKDQEKETVQSDSTIEALLPEDPKVRALVMRVQELNMEVSILKERNAVLTRRIEALKASVMNLLQ